MLINKEKNMKEHSQNASGVKSYALCEQANLKNRPYMEDTSFIKDCFLQSCPKSILFGVFDGHGGPTVSNYLVKNLPGIIQEKYKKHKKNIQNLFQESFEYADNKIVQFQLQDGATATIGFILLQQDKRILYIAHVGDSSAYLFDDNNSQKLTQDHRGDNVFQLNRVIQAGGKFINKRLGGLLAVTRAFGDIPFKKKGLISKPQVKKIPIRLHHKYVVIASDGLWDFIPVKTVQEIIKQEIQPDLIALRLLKVAISKYSTDNISVAVLRL